MITAGSSFQYVNIIKLQNTSGENAGVRTIDYAQTHNGPTNKTRCVRHGSISVSGSGSSSGGSNTASTLGSGMPTMISLEQPNMEANDGIIYCDSLSESGYDDWVMPTIDQLSYALSGGCVIPDTRTSNKISTRTAAASYGEVWYMTADGSNNGISTHSWWGNYSGTFDKCIRCVR